MFSKKNTQHLDALDALSTQELEAIIQADRQQKTTDDLDAVYEALAILEERDALESCHADVDAAWKEFQTQYNTPEGDNAALYPSELPTEGAAKKKKKRSIWKAISTAAAVFALMMLMAVPVFGEKSLIQYVGQWTKSLFTFSDEKYDSEYDEEGLNGIAFKNTELIDVYMEVAMQGCEAMVVPTWIPDGFSLSELYSLETLSDIKVCAQFENGDQELTLEYSILTGDTPAQIHHAESDGEVKVENIAGIDHYFFRGGSRSFCRWVADRTECSINGNISQQELREIICCIYDDQKNRQDSSVHSDQEIDPGDGGAQSMTLQELSQEVLAKGCEARVVPTWIPDGLSLTLLDTGEMPKFTQVYALFENNEEKLCFVYAILTGEDSAGYFYEKSDNEVTVENIAGVDHYFFRNARQYVCVWTADGVECSISFRGSQEDLRKIVYSIYSEVE